MSKFGDFDAVWKDIMAILKRPGYDDGHIGPVLVRLAWHSAATGCVETDTGGSNGAGMRYEADGGDPANVGLQDARIFLESIKDKHSWITYSDLWTLAVVVAIKEMGGPEIPWRVGRTDFVTDSKLPLRGRLPDATKSSDQLRHIFYRIRFNNQEIVAVSGSHNLGRCHTDRSGFESARVNNPIRFSNQYFRLLLNAEWKKKKLLNDLEQFAYIDKVTEKELMMLPTDMALIQDAKYRPGFNYMPKIKIDFFKTFPRVLQCSWDLEW